VIGLDNSLKYVVAIIDVRLDAYAVCGLVGGVDDDFSDFAVIYI
jgi:uncharacterized metal-binding protein